MARAAGYAGSVYIGANKAGVKSWTLDDVQNTEEGRGFDDTGAPHPVATTYDWSGSFEGFKDGAPIAKGSEISLELRETQTATQKWTGTAIITARHTATAVDGLIAYSYDFVGKGALTPPSA